MELFALEEWLVSVDSSKLEIPEKFEYTDKLKETERCLARLQLSLAVEDVAHLAQLVLCADCEEIILQSECISILCASVESCDPPLVQAILLFFFAIAQSNSLRLGKRDIAPVISICMAKHPTHAGVLSAACLLISKMALYDFCCTIPKIVSAMTSLPADAVLQSRACRALGEMANFEKYAESLLNAVPLVILAIRTHTSHISMQHNAMYFIYRMCEHKDILCRDLVHAIGFVLERQLNHEELQERGAWTLYKLSLNAKLQNKELLCQESGLKQLLNAAQIFPNNINIQSATCNTILTLAFNSESNTTKIAELQGIDVCVKALQMDSTKVLIAAIDALSAVAYHSLARSLEVDRKGGIDGVLAVMNQHVDQTKLQEVSCVCIGTLAWSQGLKEVIAHKNGINTIFKVLQAHLGNGAIVRNSCRALSMLVVNCDVNVSLLIQSGGLSTLLQAVDLHVANERVVLHGCLAYRCAALKLDILSLEHIHCTAVPILTRALQLHSKNAPLCQMICRLLLHLSSLAGISWSPTVQVMVQIIRDQWGASEVLVDAVKVLAVISCKQDDKLTATILQFQAVPVLLRVMKEISASDPHFPVIQHEALNAIAYYAHTSDLLVAEVLQYDAIPQIVAVMEQASENFKVQATACAALAPLAFRNEESAKRIAGLNAIELVIKAMSTHHAYKLHEVGLLLLANLFWHSQITHKSDLTANGIRCIIESMRTNLQHPAIQKAACRVLSHLAHNSVSNKNEICNSGGIEAILDAMRAHPERARNQYHACAALKNMAWKSDRMTEEIVAKGGVAVLSAVLRNHSSNEALRTLAGQVYNFLAMRVSQEEESPPASERDTPPPSPKRSEALLQDIAALELAESPTDCIRGLRPRPKLQSTLFVDDTENFWNPPSPSELPSHIDRGSGEPLSPGAPISPYRYQKAAGRRCIWPITPTKPVVLEREVGPPSIGRSPSKVPTEHEKTRAKQKRWVRRVDQEGPC